jgi:hypothetical protein
VGYQHHCCEQTRSRERPTGRGRGIPVPDALRCAANRTRYAALHTLLAAAPETRRDRATRTDKRAVKRSRTRRDRGARRNRDLSAGGESTAVV